MPANALLILPDFALMMFGFVLSRFFSYERPFWAQAEKLVYFVLFPPLLFGAISGADFSIVSEAKVLAAAAAAFACAVALDFAGRRLLQLPSDVFAPVVQTAFRYNSYVGLALAQSLLGARGVALMALIVAVLVPVANVLAASTGYVLAARMGANAAPVAVLITVQTCLSMLTLPLWVSAPAMLR